MSPARSGLGRLWAGLGLALAAAAWLAPALAQADTPALNRTYSVESADGSVVLELIPAQRIGGTDLGRGAARSKASGQVLWTVDWFARKVYLLSDGRGLIRMGPWARDWTGLSDLALAFYQRGREVRRYSVRDLIRDRSRLLRTASHYFWQKPEAGQTFLSADEKTIRLLLIDGGVRVFDTATGEKMP